MALRGSISEAVLAELIRVFVGWDPREKVAYDVLQHSIQERSSKPVLVGPVRLSQLDIFKRPRDPLQSTDFSFSRFLVPYLCDYDGWAVFMDCDMLCQDDIAKLWKLRDPQYAVQVVKHDYQPIETTKFLNQPQTRYAKKNWSSVILFNNRRCRRLTPEYVNTASGLELHQFKWIRDDEIGAIPENWNHLVRAGITHSQR